MQILKCKCGKQRVYRDEINQPNEARAKGHKPYYVNESKTCARCLWKDDKMVKSVQENMI